MLCRLAGTEPSVRGREPCKESGSGARKRRIHLSGPRSQEKPHHPEPFRAALPRTFASGQSVTWFQSTSCDSPTRTPTGAFCQVNEKNEASYSKRQIFRNFGWLLFLRLLIPMRKQTGLPLLFGCHEDFGSRASPPSPPPPILTKIIARLSCAAAIVGFVIGTSSNPTWPRRRVP